MADETADIIEETSDEAENWIFYDNDNTPYTNSDTNIFNGAEPELIFADPSELANDDTFQYDNELADHDSKDQIAPCNDDDHVDNDDENDLSKHTLILRESINDNAQLVEEFFCQQCNIAFKTIEEFLESHPCTEFFNENPDQPNNYQQERQDKLWDLVENLDATDDDNDDDEVIELKPNVKSSATTNDNEVIELKSNVKSSAPTNGEDDNSDNAVDLDKERYFCYECQQVFTDLSTAENHDCLNQPQITTTLVEPTPLLEELPDFNLLRCELCSKDYTSLRSFTNHQRWHKKSANSLKQPKTLQKVTAICGICNTIFTSEKNLKLHMKMHKKHTIRTIQEALPVGAQDEYNELNQFFCEICNKSFDQKLLVIHKNMHQNIEEYNCSKCNKLFENLPSYEIHLQMHASDNNSSNAKQYSPSKKLNDLIINTESPSYSNVIGNGQQRKHSCQYCGKEFQRPYEKVKHERIHTGEKPYECEVCGKTFRVSYSLTLHLRTHTDIRPYVCATCNKRFKQHSVYVHHMKTHETERAYKCDICGKSFRTSVQLGGHKNSHSKPFNCTECNRPFASLYAVKIHMKTHNKTHKSNKNLKNRCAICGASYARLFALRYHLKEQHGLDVDSSQLLDSENVSASNMPKDMDVETEILMNAANEANVNENQQLSYMNDNEEVDDIDVADNGLIQNQVDHEENIEQSICDKNFRTSVQLGGHKNSHSKPFNCTECNRPFASLDAVKIHMKTHNKTHKSNKNLKNRCAICGASYARLFALRCHLKEQHGLAVDSSQLLDSENVSASNIPKEMDVETEILMNAANEANVNENQQLSYMNDNEEVDDIDVADNGLIQNQVDHEENIEQSIQNNVYLDETEAATQTILNAEEIIIDNFHAEEIITDWLSK